MKREQATQRLERMISVIDAQQLPVPAKAFYVFGSYARGALEPGDLDVVLVHEPLPHELSERCYLECHGDLVRAAQRLQAVLTRPLRRPGERMDLLTVTDLSELLTRGSVVKKKDLVLLWSARDRDWRPKLAALGPNPRAGRTPRNHILSLKRFNDSLSTMEHVMSLLESDHLRMTRMPLTEIVLPTSAAFQERLRSSLMGVGRDNAKLLPYVLWWFGEQRLRSLSLSRGEVWNYGCTHRAHLGRPSLHTMLWQFGERSDLLAQCLVAHLKRDEPNELLLFERGPLWTDTDRSEPPPAGWANARPLVVP